MARTKRTAVQARPLNVREDPNATITADGRVRYYVNHDYYIRSKLITAGSDEHPCPVVISACAFSSSTPPIF